MDHVKRLSSAVFAVAWHCMHVLWLCAAPLAAQEQALTLGSVEDAAIHDIVFVDHEHGWAVGDHGVIWHTIDGGAHWHEQNSGTHVGLYGVSFANRELGWAVGGESRPYLHTSQATVLRTTDGGKTWSAQLALLPAMHGVKFFDAEHGIAWGRGSGNEPLGAFITDDSGRNWRSFAVGPASAWWGGDFLDARGGVVVGPRGTMTELAHGDALPITRTHATDIHAASFGTDGTGWAVGAEGVAMRSDDAGKTWQNVDVLPADLSEAITWNTVATHGSHVWIAGSPGTVVLHSPDDGKSWQGHATGHRTPVHKLAFVDDSNGWAVGALGIILHTSDSGQTWTAQQRGGERAAVLILATDARQLPFATLAKLSADGYRTAVHVFCGPSPALRGRPSQREGDDNTLPLGGSDAQGLATQPTGEGQEPGSYQNQGEGFQTRSQFNDDPTHHARLVEALTSLGCNSVTRSPLNCADQEAYRLEVARLIRIWRPAVVVGPDASASDLDQQLAAAITDVVNQSTDVDRFSQLTEQLAVPPWQVSRVFAVAGGETRGTHRVDYTAAIPGTGKTLAEVATSARSLLIDDYELSPETDEFQLQASLLGEPTASLDDLAAGLSIVHGSDCRRPQPTALPFDAQLARRLAEKRRNLTNIFRFAEGNPALLSQVGQMTSDLDDGAAAALLFELAAQFRDSNQTQLAADTLNLLARRFPAAPVTDQALTWLVQWYASGETAHAYRANARALQQATSTAQQDVRQATALLETDADSAAAEFAQQRFSHAVQLVEHIAHTRPLLYAEPQIRVPWARAVSRLSQPEPKALASGHSDSTPTSASPNASAFGSKNGADRYLESLSIRYPGDPWQECGAMEQWLADHTRPAPAKPRIDCRFTADRPTLDGVLEEPCWEKARSLTPSADSANPNPQSAIMFAYDEQYFYLAIRCGKAADLSYVSDGGERIYDADLADHDRTRILIDVDRDYTTYYSLTIDHRGFTNDACWGDTSWNPKWFVAAGGDEEHWTVEAAIPWAELAPVAPTTGAAWAVSSERVLPSADSEQDRVSPRDFSVMLLK